MMGEYFKEKPKSKIKELQREIFLLNKRVDEIEQKFVAVEDYERELNATNNRLNKVEYNLSVHNHMDGKCVIIRELGYGDDENE
jgi:predicted RNase H-like nuclease (RuvC/YqgF family)